MLATEGPRGTDLICQSCHSKPGKWRCKHCLGARSLCGVCCRNVHQLLPFHRVERWNGRYFHVGALWQVGLKLSLGHEGMACPSVARTETDAEDEGQYFGCYFRLPNRILDTTEGYGLGPPTAATEGSGFEGDMWGDPEIPITADNDDDDDDDVNLMDAPGGEMHPAMLPRPPAYDSDRNPFVAIVDVSGIHHLPVVRCACITTEARDDIAFLEMGLFPTSFERIQTLFTMDVLKDYRLSNLECKTSAYQYYQKLRRLTCPAFPRVVLNRYRELRRLSREYRNLKLWKMHGRGHDEPEGLDLVPAGPVTPETQAPINDTVVEAMDGVQRGKLASFCPACPQPGVNLPPDWEDDPNQYVPLFSYELYS